MLTSTIFLAIILAIVHAQEPECLVPLNVAPDDCCRTMPLFVKEEVLSKCGLQDIDENIDESIPCEPFECLMGKENVLTSDNKINRFTIYSVISSQYGTEWHSAINVTLIKCFEEMDDIKSDCESRQFASCFLHYIIINCPENYWINSTDCTAAKTFLENCVEPAL